MHTSILRQCFLSGGEFMYRFLKSRLPLRIAQCITAIWYLALIAIALYFSFEPKAEFNYLNI